MDAFFWREKDAMAWAQKIWIDEESGSVCVRIDFRDGFAKPEVRLILTPLEAMKFAKAFEKAAIEGLRNSA